MKSFLITAALSVVLTFSFLAAWDVSHPRCTNCDVPEGLFVTPDSFARGHNDPVANVQALRDQLANSRAVCVAQGGDPVIVSTPAAGPDSDSYDAYLTCQMHH
jgi:hypothetical protein